MYSIDIILCITTLQYVTGERPAYHIRVHVLFVMVDFRGLQDRASCHAKEGVAKGAQEEETPPRCLVDLRPRRGKRSVAPMNRGKAFSRRAI